MAAELDRDVADVGADRVRRLAELAGDAVPVQAADQQVENFPLSRRQLLDELLLRCLGRARIGVSQAAEQLGRQPAAAQQGSPHSSDDLLDRGVLGQEAHCTRLDGMDDGADIGIGGQHHDCRRSRHGHQLPGQVDPADVPEPHIHDHHIGPTRSYRADHLIRVADRRRLEIRLRAEDRLQALCEDPVIIDNEQADGH